MSRDNNNSDRPKRPRISTRKSSDDSRASRSGNSSGSKSFKKPFSKTGERKGPEHKGSNSKFEQKPFKKNTGSFENSDEDFGSKSERKPYITNKSESYGKKPFGKSGAKRGGKNFDTRDKYERGSLKYGRRPSNGDERNEDRAKSFVQKRRLNKIEKDVYKDSIRLNKYIANSGICSRREADELITQGLVEVNGKVVTEMGYQVQKTDRVIFDGQSITPEKPVYVLLNKPKGYIST
ncbi:S4 domain-containing protein, partial [Chryseobacterium sp. PMSZPI]